MKKLNITIALAALLTAGLINAPLLADADRTTYPVVFAHGMAGFDDILGYDYWGNDYGTFVGDPCDGFLEVSCNGEIDRRQKAYQSAVTSFQSSEVRGLQLADNIESYMASVGASKINIIGHSQGGLDGRKAAKILRQRKGYTVVRVMMSVSSPHRGSPVAKHILTLGNGVTSVVTALANIYGSVVYGPGNDAYAAGMQFIFNDFNPDDGVITGGKAFNNNYPVSSSYASRYVSLITAQTGLSVNPALFIVKNGLHNIDGDGYCSGDCNNDGAAGKGDGRRTDLDDDGLVGINSQQMGYRLRYNECFLCLDYMNTYSGTGYVGNLNYPNSTQMTSSAAIVEQDHLDVIGVGPDTFDEEEFYAAALDYIAYYD